MPDHISLQLAHQRPFPVRLWNIVGRVTSGPSLKPDVLIKKARRKTGLNDLGDDFDMEPLKVLMTSIEQEAQLHPFGQFMIEQKISNQIINRLWANHWFKKYPEILEQELLPVYMITGLQRTGTTRLQRLLSEQSGARALKSWEALYPSPLKNPKEFRKRIAKTKMNEKAVKYIAPGFHAIHPIYYDAPEEDVLLLDLAFMSTTSEAIMHVPSYAHWVETNDQKPAYEYEVKLLKLLQWQHTGTFWVVKSPHHLEFLKTAIDVYPDLKVIWAHRNPARCIPSFLSMVYHSRAMFSSRVTVDDVSTHWIRKTKRMVQTGLESMPPSTIHLSYDNIISRPAQTIDHITGNDVDISPDQPYSSRHRYSLEDFGLDENTIQKEFAEYYTFTESNNIAL